MPSETAEICDMLSLVSRVSRAMLAASPMDDALELAHGDHHNLDVSFSHISRLPPEILTQIFMIWFEIEDSDFASTPFLVSHVCSHWRRIAFDTPRLWRDIVLQLRPSSFTDDFLAILGNYLLRSEPHTIDVNLLEDSGPLDDADDIASGPDSDHRGRQTSLSTEDDILNKGIQNLVQQVLLSNARIKTLTLVCHSSAVAEALLANMASEPMPSLETLNLIFDDAVDDTELLVQDLIHNNSTRLSSLALMGNCFQFWTLDDMDLPWSQLSYLEIELSFLDEAFAFLPKCSSLQTCIMHCSFCWDETGDRPLILKFELLHLTKLDIRIFFHGHHETLELFFHLLHAPRLETFMIKFWEQHRSTFDAYYDQHLFTRSGASLTSLQLEHLRFEPGKIIPLLQKLPALEHLVLKFCLEGCVDELFTGLQHNSIESFPPLVPRLTRLEVETSEDANQESLLKLIPSSLLSRCHGQDGAVVAGSVKALEYVCIHLAEMDVDMTWKYSPGTAVGDFSRGIERCRDAGMEVDMYVRYEEF